MSDPPNDRDPAWLKYQRDLKQWEMDYQHRLDWQVESFKAVVSFSTTTIRLLVLINGGAVIAMLALLGNLWGKDAEGQKAAAKIAGALDDPLLAFVVGLGAGVITGGISYLAQTAFSDFHNRIGIGLQVVACVTAAVSFGAFVIGSYWAVDAFVLGFRST
jgi:hypothetical protein